MKPPISTINALGYTISFFSLVTATAYMDYGLIICQANGRPIMTEHLNKRFKEVLEAMGDPTIDVSEIVFHSIRHTSTGVKLRLSGGDLKAVQGDGG